MAHNHIAERRSIASAQRRFLVVPAEVVRIADCGGRARHDNRDVGGLHNLRPGEPGALAAPGRIRGMRWAMVAIIGAGAAARAAWGLMKAYERLAAARDELDE